MDPLESRSDGDMACDLIVIGAGAAGMAAAATGAALGLDVILLEASDHVGGTSALSAGSLWVPNTILAQDDDPDAAARYLDAVVGNRARPEMRQAFLQRGPQMIAFLQSEGAIDLAPYPYHPDYVTDMPGAVTSGRALGAQSFDAKVLGQSFALLRPPLPEFTVFGGMMVDRTDIDHLLNMGKRPKSFAHALRLVTRFALDRLTAPRGRRLVMGNALAGRLLAYLRGKGVDVRTNTKVHEIIVENGQATGVALKDKKITAGAGIVVTTGGFSHHATLRDELYPSPVASYSAVPAGNTGSGIDMLRAAGGHLDTSHANAAFWAPASTRLRKDSSRAVFPHFVLDRAKPGILAVNGSGRRFVNESTSYHRFVEGMYGAGAIPCHLICNGDFIRRYGLGIIRPMTRNLKPWLDEGYITTGATIEALAQAIGADPATLSESVTRMEAYAAKGTDPEFGRGTTAYERNLGNPSHGPNPCLGPIGTGPYYALPIYPADIGTSMGISTDTDARVLDASGSPIDGLYAAGNDMASVMGGTYPGPGITLGPAMTFGYVAAQHAASRKE